MKGHFLKAFLIAILLSSTKAQAVIQDGVNTEDFASICELLALQGGGFTNDPQDWTDGDLYDEIAAINMTYASDAWRKQFNKDGTEQGWITELPVEHKANTAYKSRWQEWLKSARAIPTDAAFNQKREQLKINTLDASKYEIARNSVAEIAEQARTLNSKLKQINRKERKASKQKIQTFLNQAVYGKDDPTAADPTEADALGASNAAVANRGTACTASKDGPRGKTLAAIALCICTKGQSGGSSVDSPCWTEKTQEVDYPAASGQVAQKFAELKKRCPKREPVTLTAEAVSRMVNNLIRRFKTSSTGSYIGTYVQNGCNGKNTDGVCMKYTDVTTASTNKVTETHWARQLIKLQKDLESDETMEQKGKALTEQLEALKDRAEKIATEAHIGLPSQQTLQKLAGKQQPGEQNDKCKAATNKTAAGCAAIGCEFDAAKAECKPKASVEGEAAPEEEKQKITEKCKGKLEDACKKAP